MLPAATQIAHAHLHIRDMSRALAFYRDALGFKTIAQTDDSVYLSANGAPPHLIALTASTSAQPRPSRTTGLFHVAIRMPDRAALARVFYRLAALRVEFGGFSDHAVSEAIYLDDPDGNGVELYRDRPREQWPMAGDQVAMTTERLDVQALLREGEHRFEDWPGADARTDIGHIHLQVSDLAQAEAFYSGLLGFAVMQRNYAGALFVAAGGYHHHVGLNIWASQGAPPAPPAAAGLREYGVRIPERAAWQAVVERLRAGGVAVETGERDGQPTATLLDPFGVGLALLGG